MRKLRARFDDHKMKDIFTSTHKMGSNKFGFAWIKANQMACNAAVELGIDPVDLRA